MPKKLPLPPGQSEVYEGMLWDRYPIHLSGETHWTEFHEGGHEYPGLLRRFFLKSCDEFSIELESLRERVVYSGLFLRTPAGGFHGTLLAVADDHRRWEVPVKCGFSMDRGQYVLYGLWSEGQYTFKWHAQLHLSLQQRPKSRARFAAKKSTLKDKTAKRKVAKGNRKTSKNAKSLRRA